MTPEEVRERFADVQDRLDRIDRLVEEREQRQKFDKQIDEMTERVAEMADRATEMRRTTEAIARAQGVDVPESPSQNGTEPSTWDIFNDG